MHHRKKPEWDIYVPLELPAASLRQATNSKQFLVEEGKFEVSSHVSPLFKLL